jgi:Protein of unknown function (DUF1189)
MMMVDKINDLLFHPSTLIKFRKVNIFKTIGFLFILGFISILVTLIDFAKFEGYSIGDQTYVEKMLDIDFSVVTTLPDCQLENKVLSCENEDEVYQLGKGMQFFHFVIDVNNNLEINDSNRYIIFTKNTIKFGDRYGKFDLGYDILPSAWQQFDLGEIKESDNPEKALFQLFIDGYNEIYKQTVPLVIVLLIIISYVMMIVQTLFYSLLFFLLYRKYGYKFREVFKITTFAQTFPIILGLILTLVGMGSSFLVTMLTFLYVYFALIGNINREQPTNQ